jgi:hypothetical protein
MQAGKDVPEGTDQECLSAPRAAPVGGRFAVGLLEVGADLRVNPVILSGAGRKARQHRNDDEDPNEVSHAMLRVLRVAA